MKVFVSGSNGYVGSLLVPHLLADGHEVVGFDTQYFGDAFLPKDNGRLKLIKGDIRDTNAVAAAMYGCDAALWLACISNDYGCNLDEKLSEEINIHAFEPCVLAAKSSGIKRFIYCSSSSVYGINDLPDVTEDCELIPVTLYNRSKMACEKLLLPHHSNDFTCAILRPATVCGPAPRMRFDLTVNVMTRDAVCKGGITVFGGSQKRPNLHIKDMVAAYKLMLKAPKERIGGEAFNVGRQNMTVLEIAQLIKQVVEREMGKPVTVDVQGFADNRSYKVNSDKIAKRLGFTPQHSVEDAIRDICLRFKSNYWPDALTNPNYTNILQYVQQGMGAQKGGG